MLLPKTYQPIKQVVEVIEQLLEHLSVTDKILS